MSKGKLNPKQININAQREFENAESIIRSFNIKIDLYNGTDLPDEIFPNNWISINNNYVIL